MLIFSDCLFTSRSDEMMDRDDDEVAGINELGMKLLQIKELHPVLQREVTRHKFPGGSGILMFVLYTLSASLYLNRDTLFK